MKKSSLLYALLLIAFLFGVSTVVAQSGDGEQKGKDDSAEVAMSPPLPGATGGPDSFGYTWIDTNSPGGPYSDGSPWETIPTPTSISLSDDQLSSAITLPFTFTYYGTAYSSVYVCANGFINFSGPAGSCSFTPPTGTGSDGAIAGWWEDLNPSVGGTITYGTTIDASPNRRFIVQWTAVPFFSNNNPVTFQIKLYETSNAIQVVHSNAVSDGDNNSQYVMIDQPGGSAVSTAFMGTGVPSGGPSTWAAFFLPPANNTVSGATITCSSPQTAIPDGAGAAVTNDIVISSTDAVTDLDVWLNVPHSWLSDLDITLTHVGTGNSVTLFDNSCGSNHDIVGARIDDEASGVTCGSAFPAVGFQGSQKPGSGTLSTFDNGPYGGTWRLSVDDEVDVDLGTLMQWCMIASTTTPVTLTSFEAQPAERGVQFNWSTTTEISNVGFRLYEETPDGRRLLTERMELSHVVNAATPQQYSTVIESVTGDTFYIEDVDLRGHTHLNGPYKLGEAYGAAVTPQPIEWSAIAAEHTMLAAGRESARVSTAQATFTPEMEAAANHRGIEMRVDQDGVYRVTYADLVALGINPAGVRVNRLAVLNQGQPVPISITGGATVNPNTVIEFIGYAVDSVYTATNTYTLTVDRASAERIERDDQPIPAGDAPTSYLTTTTVENENTYSFLAPNGDPWYDTMMFAYGGDFVHNTDLVVDHLVSEDGDATLHLDVWGLTDWNIVGDDHHLLVALNGIQLADVTFDGLTTYALDVVLPVGVLQEGINALTLTVPKPTDPEILWDMIVLDSFGVTYPRAFVADNGTLTFTAAADVFEVSDMQGDGDTIYRVKDDGSVARIRNIEITPGDDDTWSVRFPGDADGATYWLTTDDAVVMPALAVSQKHTDITSGSVDYLIISHPGFIDGLTPLTDHHTANGFTVKVVDVDEIYAQFSSGIFDAQAIKTYITHAIQNMDVEYVLLVGGDTYDYFDYLGLGSISFIPSLYAPTEPYVSFAPLDPLYTDIDDNGVPDATIGRFPVRTMAELDMLVAKTLTYADKDYGQTIVVAADTLDGSISFADSSDAIVSQLPASWHIDRAYIDDLGVDGARDVLLNSVNGGVALTSFMGHSGSYSWTFSNPPFFLADDAAALANSGQPTVVTQWGCWNTYYVDPYYNTLAHTFMLSGDNGAAAVLGASTITSSSSEEALGMRVMPLAVTPDMTLGQAIQDAKTDLAATNPGLRDVLLGWTLLGDPALVVDSTTP